MHAGKQYVKGKNAYVVIICLERLRESFRETFSHGVGCKKKGEEMPLHVVT